MWIVVNNLRKIISLRALLGTHRKNIKSVWNTKCDNFGWSNYIWHATSIMAYLKIEPTTACKVVMSSSHHVITWCLFLLDVICNVMTSYDDSNSHWHIHIHDQFLLNERYTKWSTKVIYIILVIYDCIEVLVYVKVCDQTCPTIQQYMVFKGFFLTRFERIVFNNLD
jgi:hypothetical protein